jgi:carboxypeptidase family protein
VPLPRVVGIVVDELTGMPIGEGSVSLRTENYVRTLEVDENGRFETLSLFPGTYELNLWILGHTSSFETVTVGDKDVQVKLTSRKD